MAVMPGFFLMVIVGIIVSTLTIILVFVIINVCISKQAAVRRAQMSRPNHTNSSHEHLFPAQADVEQKPPPLPSRDQFLTQSRSNSYEEVDTLVKPVKVHIQSSTPPPLTVIPQCETQSIGEDMKSVCESYDDIEQLNTSAWQSYGDVTSIPDYLELDEDLPALQKPPQLLDTDNCSRESLASYDDIGEIDAIGAIDRIGVIDDTDAIDNVSEDYDDIG